MPRIEIGSTRFWRNSVAMIVVLVGLAGVLNMGLQSVNSIYNKSYEPAMWASERSVTNSLDDIQKAIIPYQAAEWEKTIELLNKTNLPEENAFVKNFYLASSYQNLNEYEEAIQAYSKVIEHGNNLFIDEAQWYRSLCYLKLNKKAEAKQELLAVIDRKGSYEKDAKAILRRLRYSFK